MVKPVPLRSDDRSSEFERIRMELWVAVFHSSIRDNKHGVTASAIIANDTLIYFDKTFKTKN